jgi:protein gp37
VGDTTIEWTEKTWNPLTGCTKVSPGCTFCYAKTMHERFHGAGSFDTVMLHPDRLDQPLRWRQPRRIFVNSMSDLFHKDVPDEFIARVFAVMSLAPQHSFQLLTKRHARMRSLLDASWFEPMVRVLARVMKYGGGRPDPRMDDENYQAWPLPNVWLGVSVEDQHWADIRIPALMATPAAVRWISAEPLLGPVDLGRWLTFECPRCSQRLPWTDGRDRRHGDEVDEYWCQHCGQESPLADVPGPLLDWVVVGGESGPGARPMHPAWARQIRDQCAAAGVPFLFKQRGAWSWDQPDASAVPGARVDLGDGTDVPVWRVGKKAAGRELDGRQHDGYPEVRSA